MAAVAFHVWRPVSQTNVKPLIRHQKCAIRAQFKRKYIEGTAPADTIDFIRAVISFSNGIPLVTWSPNLNANGEVRTYIVLGKTNLTDAARQSPANFAHRSFKVKVSLP